MENSYVIWGVIGAIGLIWYTYSKVSSGELTVFKDYSDCASTLLFMLIASWRLFVPSNDDLGNVLLDILMFLCLIYSYYNSFISNSIINAQVSILVKFILALGLVLCLLTILSKKKDELGNEYTEVNYVSVAGLGIFSTLIYLLIRFQVFYISYKDLKYQLELDKNNRMN